MKFPAKQVSAPFIAYLFLFFFSFLVTRSYIHIQIHAPGRVSHLNLHLTASICFIFSLFSYPRNGECCCSNNYSKSKWRKILSWETIDFSNPSDFVSGWRRLENDSRFWRWQWNKRNCHVLFWLRRPRSKTKKSIRLQLSSKLVRLWSFFIIMLFEEEGFLLYKSFLFLTYNHRVPHVHLIVV